MKCLQIQDCYGRGLILIDVKINREYWKKQERTFKVKNCFCLYDTYACIALQFLDVEVWMGGQYNFITIFYFFDIQAPISIRNFSSNKIFFKISLQEWKVGV